MARTILVEKDVQIGRRLIEALERHHIPVHSALWLYLPESEEWQLVIATPLVDEIGPRATYVRVQSILRDPDEDLDLTLLDMAVESPRSERIRVLGSAIDTGPGIKEIRLTGNAFQGMYFADAHIYRSQPVPRGKSRRTAVRDRPGPNEAASREG